MESEQTNRQKRREGIECPRCGGLIPNDKTPGLYPGALSRVDNETEICSECGLDEALSDLVRGDPTLTKADWVNP